MMTVDDTYISSIICEPTEGYQQVHHRPFSIAVSSPVAEGIEQLSSDIGISNFTPASISNGISNAITHQQVGQPVFMPYGWNQRRLKVLMTVMVKYVTGAVEKLDFQGYTDYFDPSSTVPLDPNSTFFINNVTTVAVNNINGVMSEKVISSNQILENEVSRCTQSDAGDMHNIYSLRPQDVIIKMEQSTDDSYAAWDTNSDVYQDTSVQLGGLPVMSRRTNNSPGKYLSDLLNAYGLATQTAEMEPGSNNVVSAAYSNVIEENVSRNQFLKHFRDSIDNRQVSGSFTFRELLQVYPTLFTDGVIHMIPSAPPPTMFSERLDIHDTSSVMANTIAQQVLSAMYRSGLSWVRVQANNRGASALDGPTVTVTKADPLIKHAVAAAVSLFTGIFKTEIMPYVTKNDMMTVVIAVDANVNSDTKVSIQIDGDGNVEPVTYTFPSFADHLYSPVLDTTSSQEVGVGLELLYNSMNSPGYLSGFDESTSTYGIPGQAMTPQALDNYGDPGYVEQVPAPPSITEDITNF